MLIYKNKNFKFKYHLHEISDLKKLSIAVFGQILRVEKVSREKKKQTNINVKSIDPLLHSKSEIMIVK